MVIFVGSGPDSLVSSEAHGDEGESTLLVEQTSAVWQDFKSEVYEIETLRPNSELVANKDWDLALKRTFALWYCARNGIPRIEFRDDDISNVSWRESPNVGQGSQIMGCSILDFPDQSFVGHLRNRYMEEEYRFFFSGACATIDIQAGIPFFPTIYNEDWIFVIYAMNLGFSYSLNGSAKQRDYNILKNPGNAEFEEAGDVLGEGLLELYEYSNFSQRGQLRFWEQQLQKRSELLAKLATILERHKLSDERHRLREAQSRLSRIAPEQLLHFLATYERDLGRWESIMRRSLKERMYGN